MFEESKNLDAREIELPETMYIRDIETRVFQAICLQSLSKIEGIGLLEGTLFDSLLGREMDRVKGIHVEQDQKKQSVMIRIEINIIYGISIPEKAEEVQQRISEEISRWTGLHVASVHIIFKNLILPPPDSEEEPENAAELEEAF